MIYVSEPDPTLKTSGGPALSPGKVIVLPPGYSIITVGTSPEPKKGRGIVTCAGDGLRAERSALPSILPHPVQASQPGPDTYPGDSLMTVVPVKTGVMRTELLTPSLISRKTGLPATPRV